MDDSSQFSNGLSGCIHNKWHYFKETKWKTMLCMAFSFGFFQAAMPFLGWLGASRFSHEIENIDHWIAFILLLFIGGKMFGKVLKKKTADMNTTHQVPKWYLHYP